MTSPRMKRLIHMQHYQLMLRRLVISMILGIAAATVVWLFHQSMLQLEWLFLGSRRGSLVAAAADLPLWRRLLTPALGD